MNVSELYKALSFGPLANLSLANEGNGSIREQDQARIIHHANDGLLKLYSRFVLCEKDVLIEQVAHITNYHLKARFAESQWDPDEEDYPYIKDLGKEPFTEDVIKILEVYDSNGVKLPLNDVNQQYSLFTPQANVLQVPRPMDRVSLSVLYQAKHETLDHTNMEQEIDLPEVLHAALLAHVAAQVYSGIATAEALQKAQEQSLIYENVCLSAIENDLVSTSISTTNTSFAKRGWA